jgi:hypothetical protein
VLRDTSLALITAWRAKDAGPASAPAASSHAADAKAPPARPNGGSGVSPGSFLGLMLSARDKASGRGLSDDQLVAQAQAFMLAGAAVGGWRVVGRLIGRCVG